MIFYVNVQFIFMSSFICQLYTPFFSLFFTAQITCDSNDSLKEKGTKQETKLTLKLFTHTRAHAHRVQAREREKVKHHSSYHSPL